MPVVPVWGARYEVRPDSEAEAVDWERFRRAKVKKGLEEVLKTQADDKGVWWAQTTRRLPEEIKKGLAACWSEIRALEVVLEDIADEFGGEDVLKPVFRAEVEATREEALRVYAFFKELVEGFELPEASGDDVLDTRALIDKWSDIRR